MEYEVARTCMLVNMGLTRSECASWVQAWGSIFAILASFVLAKFSYARENNRKKEEAKLVAQLAAIPIISEFTYKVDYLEKFLRRFPLNSVEYKREHVDLIFEHSTRFDFPLEKLIPLMGQVDVDIANSMSIAMVSVVQLRKHVDAARKWPGEVSEVHQKAIQELLKYIISNAHHSNKSLLDFLADRGVPLDRRLDN